MAFNISLMTMVVIIVNVIITVIVANDIDGDATITNDSNGDN